MGIIQIKEAAIEKLKRAPKAAVYIAAAAIIAAALMIIKPPKEAEVEKVSLPAQENSFSAESYAEELEKKLTEAVSKINGVGEVKIMLTVEGTEEKVYAADISESDGRSESETVIIGTKEALLKSQKNPEVRGVLVVCSGGGKPAIKEKVVNAVATVLDIPTAKVYVTDGK